MLDNTLIPAYQDRVASHTLNTDDEHTTEQFDDEEQSLMMTGTGRRAEKHERIIRIMDKADKVNECVCHPTHWNHCII